MENQITALVTIKIQPEDDPQVLVLFREAEVLRDWAIRRVISSDTDLAPASDDLSMIAKLKKALTEKKAEYVKPIKGYLDDVNAAFAKIMTPLDEADRATRNKILDYRSAVAKRAAEAEEINRQAQELARRQAQFSGTGEFTVDTTPMQAPAPVSRVSTDLGTAGIVRNTSWELVDFALVPDQFKVLDSGKITKLVKGGGTIPGIKIVVTEGLRVTTR